MWTDPGSWGSVIPPLEVQICFWSSASWPPTSSTCSDSGERCGVKQAMILRNDPHYLNAWNRLALQPLMSFCLNTPSSNKAFSVNSRIYELIAWQENSTGPRVPTGLFLLFLFLSFFHFPVFCALWIEFRSIDYLTTPGSLQFLLYRCRRTPYSRNGGK